MVEGVGWLNPKRRGGSWEVKQEEAMSNSEDAAAAEDMPEPPPPPIFTPLDSPFLTFHGNLHHGHPPVCLPPPSPDYYHFALHPQPLPSLHSFHPLHILPSPPLHPPFFDFDSSLPSLVDSHPSLHLQNPTPSSRSDSRIPTRNKAIRRNLERSMAVATCEPPDSRRRRHPPGILSVDGFVSSDVPVLTYADDRDLQGSSIFVPAAPKSELLDAMDDSGVASRRKKDTSIVPDEPSVDAASMPTVKKARVEIGADGDSDDAAAAANHGVNDFRQNNRRGDQECDVKTINVDDDHRSRMTHIAVERNRRKQMNDHLAILRSLMPPTYVQRADQASIIGGAVEFIKELKQLVETLEGQRRRRRCVAEAGGGMRRRIWVEGGNGGDVAAAARTAAAEVEARVAGGAEVNVNVLCVKAAADQLIHLAAAIQSLSLEILRLSIATPHPLAALYSFTLKIGIDCRISVEELVDFVQQILHDIYSKSRS